MTGGIMRNRFVGTCYKCGLPVAPGTGHFERADGRWRTRHGLYPGRGRVTCEGAKAMPNKPLRFIDVHTEQEVDAEIIEIKRLGFKPPPHQERRIAYNRLTAKKYGDAEALQLFDELMEVECKLDLPWNPHAGQAT